MDPCDFFASLGLSVFNVVEASDYIEEKRDSGMVALI